MYVLLLLWRRLLLEFVFFFSEDIVLVNRTRPHDNVVLLRLQRLPVDLIRRDGGLPKRSELFRGRDVTI